MRNLILSLILAATSLLAQPATFDVVPAGASTLTMTVSNTTNVWIYIGNFSGKPGVDYCNFAIKTGPETANHYVSNAHPTGFFTGLMGRGLALTATNCIIYPDKSSLTYITPTQIKIVLSFWTDPILARLARVELRQASGAGPVFTAVY